MPTTVKYNGTEIIPAPFFSRSVEPIDYGNRWGQVTNITLDGVITDLAGSGSRLNYLNSIFSDGFKELLVESDGATYFTGQNCVLENISFGDNSFPSDAGVAVPYSVTMKHYQVPSGVTDISNEFSYQDNPDGTVDVSRKMSAKGLKTNTDAIENAYNFVSFLTGINPLSVHSPNFVDKKGLGGATDAVLLSVDESFDRLDAKYEVSEKWKYETGSSNNYISTFSLSVDDDTSQEFVNLNLTADFVGPTTGILTDDVRAAATSFDYFSKLASYGIQTTDCVLNSFNASESPDSNNISLTVAFFSGDTQGINGVFNHAVTMDWDEIKDIKTYSVNSEFKVKGPRNFKEKRINTKIAEILGGYDHYAAYLYHVIKDSKVYDEFGSARDLNPLPSDLSINEGETSPTFSLSATYSDSDYIKVKTATLTNAKTYPISAGEAEWSVNVSPERWIFSMQKAANIEGHVIVQDSQCKTREKIGVQSSVTHIGSSLELGTDVNQGESSDQIVAFAKSIESDIVALSSTQTLYLTNESVSSGEYSYSIDKQNIAKEPINSALSANKLYGFKADTYNTRNIGHQYGF
jgi:hypothetical protein